ncbi:uncharacterized protein LOC114679585 isoform X2 [Macaca mulatta]
MPIRDQVQDETHHRSQALKELTLVCMRKYFTVMTLVTPSGKHSDLSPNTPVPLPVVVAAAAVVVVVVFQTCIMNSGRKVRELKKIRKLKQGRKPHDLQGSHHCLLKNPSQESQINFPSILFGNHMSALQLYLACVPQGERCRGLQKLKREVNVAERENCQASVFQSRRHSFIPREALGLSKQARQALQSQNPSFRPRLPHCWALDSEVAAQNPSPQGDSPQGCPT